METFKREIFEQLGNLFYALAAEQHASLITSGELKMAVRKDWLDKTTNGSTPQTVVSEASHLVGVTIDTLQADQTPSSEAFSAFERFFRLHVEQFSYALKRQILETADTIMNILASGGKTNQYYESLTDLLHASVKPTEDQE